jgi:tRNA dimethylallyltransferase
MRYNARAMAEPGRIPLLVIAGPTATGKTAAAVEVAAACGGEIISADSMQIYRGLDLGTAKPTAAERARAVFHLVDIVEPDATYTAADFQRDAEAAITAIWARGRLPILCGGTGLYLRAVLRGLSFPPGALPETAELRRRLEAEAKQRGPAALHRRLAQVDPPTAARLAVGDLRRVIRALEVHEHTGRPFSELARVDEHHGAKYNARTFVLTCPRELLYARIERRVDEMLAAGWLAEVRGLRDRGLTLKHQSMQALGYRHLLGHLERGEDSVATADLIKRDTRRFAKRQLTWFRRDPATVLEWGAEHPFAAVVEVLTHSVSHLLAGDDPNGSQEHLTR